MRTLALSVLAVDISRFWPGTLLHASPSFLSPSPPGHGSCAASPVASSQFALRGVWLSTITLYLICRPPAPAFFNPSSALSSPVALADPMSLSHTSAHINYRRDEEKTQHGEHA